MASFMDRKIVVLILFSLAMSAVVGYEYNPLPVKRRTTQNQNNLLQYLSDKEYAQNMISMLNAYKGNLKNIFIETNDLVDTKYRTMKRNGDLINSLLFLPLEMYEAGR